MGIFNKLWRQENIRNETTYTWQDADFLGSLGLDNSNKDKMGEIVYFICLKTLTEIMGKLDIKKYIIDQKKGKEKIFDDRLNYLLNIEPNPYYTASTLKQCIELNRNHFGNAFVYMERDNNANLKALWLLPTTEMQMLIDNKSLFKQTNALWYVWLDSRTSKKYIFNKDEILHFKSSITWDGIVGKAIKDILADQLNTAMYGQDYLKRLYKGNMQSSKILLQYTGELNAKGEEELVRNMENFTENIGSGTFIPLPLGLQATTLDAKLVDAEFSILRQANALQIAGAFGISPNFINDYSKSSYANSVTQQQSLYTNTMMPIFEAYKQEYTRKILPTKEKKNTILEIDTKSLFKLNPIEQMEVLQKGVQSLLYTPNEGREELDLPYIDNPKANELVGNGNMINLDNVGNQYNKNGGE